MNKTTNTRGTMDAYQAAQEKQAVTNSVRMKWQKLSGKKRKRIKKLNYNHKEISIMLLRSTSSQNAASVLILAKNRLGNLKSCSVTGEYNSKEVANAIAHADRMVQCARMKVKHLKEEEYEELQNHREQNSREQQGRSAVKARVRLKKRQIEQKLSNEELKKLQEQKLEWERLEKKRKRHRREEYGKISEADMKYRQGQQAANTFESSGPAAVLELTRNSQELDEKKLEQQAQKELGISAEHASGAEHSISTVAAEGVLETADLGVSAVESVDIMI